MSEAAVKNESVGTVVVAGAANLAIAVAKLVAGMVSGSAAMLSEAAHSVADTTTEVLLYLALRRGARPADVRHPFGYGKESYVWAFIAALFTFVAGAGFAITHGVTTILVARAQRQLPGLVRRAGGLVRHRVGVPGPRGAPGAQRVPPLADHPPPVPAADRRHHRQGGVPGGQRRPDRSAAWPPPAWACPSWTGDELWDGLASILIGLLLLVVAAILATEQHLAAGRPGGARAAAPGDRARSWPACPTVDADRHPADHAARPGRHPGRRQGRLRDEATGGDIEAAADEAERRLTARYPEIRYVFLDPTRPATPAPPAAAATADRRTAPGAAARVAPLACRAWCDGGRGR